MTASSKSWVTSNVVTVRFSTRIGKFVAQLGRQRIIQGHERLVEQEQFRLHRKGARHGDATRQPEREFARIMQAMLGKLENVKQCHKCGFGYSWGDQTDVVLDRSPRKQPRFLKYHGKPAALGRDDSAVIVHVDAGDDPQHCRLAAARRAHEHADFPAGQRKGDVAEHLKRLAGRQRIGFADYANVKQFGAANVTRVVQWVAPPGFQSPG